ncbi:MAG: hypothetical protein ABI876_01715 [Bacteroidota bacterium]
MRHYSPLFPTDSHKLGFAATSPPERSNFFFEIASISRKTRFEQIFAELTNPYVRYLLFTDARGYTENIFSKAVFLFSFPELALNL